MIKLSSKQIIILSEVIVVLTIAWLVYIIADLIKPGLVSNYYDLNLHFLIIVSLFSLRLLVKDE